MRMTEKGREMEGDQVEVEDIVWKLRARTSCHTNNNKEAHQVTKMKISNGYLGEQQVVQNVQDMDMVLLVFETLSRMACQVVHLYLLGVQEWV